MHICAPVLWSVAVFVVLVYRRARWFESLNHFTSDSVQIQFLSSLLPHLNDVLIQDIGSEMRRTFSVINEEAVLSKITLNKVWQRYIKDWLIYFT